LHKIAGMQTKSSREEIDILEVVAKVIDQMRATLLLTIILPLAGGLGGFLIAQKAPTKVKSDMMVTTDLLSEEQCNFLLNQFETSTIISDVTPELPNDFISITHEIIRPYRYIADDRTVHIQISLTLNDKRSFPTFQHALLDFLENSPAATSRKKAIQEYDAKIIQGIDHELAEIEKIKGNVSGKDKLNSLNAANLYLETISLLDKKLKLETRIGSGKVFMVVDGFKNMVNERPSILISTLVGLGAGIFLLFMFLAMRYFNAYYRNYNRTKI
jgi:hypothetical protein